MQKHVRIAGAVLMGMGALHAAACTASVVVVEGGSGSGSGGAGADDSASSGQGQGQGGFGGECAGILGLRGECPPQCEEKRVLCDHENGPVEEEGPNVELCGACEFCDNAGGWTCSFGT